MPCDHRFINELLPSWQVRYLFIGTFNPGWSSESGNDAEYFYGRDTNQFWKILPKVFCGDEGKSLAGLGRDGWVQYCQHNGIGLTDLIISIKDADITNQQHFDALTRGYADDKLVQFDNIVFNTERIKQFINENNATIRGVFITRRPSSKIRRIWQQWQEIERCCREYKNIIPGALYSPSPRACRLSLASKIQEWREVINLQNI